MKGAVKSSEEILQRQNQGMQDQSSLKQKSKVVAKPDRIRLLGRVKGSKHTQVTF